MTRRTRPSRPLEHMQLLNNSFVKFFWGWKMARGAWNVIAWTIVACAAASCGVEAHGERDFPDGTYIQLWECDGSSDQLW